MHLIKKAGLIAAVTAVAMAGAVSAASAATVVNSSTGAVYTGGIQLRGNVQFKFPNGGTITCAGNNTTTFGVIGNGSTSTSTIGNSFAALGTFSSIYLGTNLASGATAPNACAVSYPGITSCTAATITNAPFRARVDPAMPNDTGVYFQIGPITVNATCITSGGGSISCSYTTGVGVPGTAGSPAAITSDKSLYSGTPPRASTITFSDQRTATAPNTPQTFFRSGGTGGASCPNTGSAGTAAVAGTVSGTFRVFTNPGGVSLHVQK